MEVSGTFFKWVIFDVDDFDTFCDIHVMNEMNDVIILKDVIWTLSPSWTSTKLDRVFPAVLPSLHLRHWSFPPWALGEKDCQRKVRTGPHLATNYLEQVLLSVNGIYTFYEIESSSHFLFSFFSVAATLAVIVFSTGYYAPTYLVRLTQSLLR